jgi:hypothetical protein
VSFAAVSSFVDGLGSACSRIKLKRAYDRASRDDGVRYLVERLWPRGIKKTELQLDGVTYTAIERRHYAVG